MIRSVWEWEVDVILLSFYIYLSIVGYGKDSWGSGSDAGTAGSSKQALASLSFRLDLRVGTLLDLILSMACVTLLEALSALAVVASLGIYPQLYVLHVSTTTTTTTTTDLVYLILCTRVVFWFFVFPGYYTLPTTKCSLFLTVNHGLVRRCPTATRCDGRTRRRDMTDPSQKHNDELPCSQRH
jgi:hypothetical protein